MAKNKTQNQKVSKKKKSAKKKSANKQPSIVDKITPIEDIGQWLSIEVYGRSGTGKTTFAGTAPKPLLILDVNDRGTISVKSQPDTFVIPIDNWSDFEDLYWYLKSGKHGYKSVVIDTLTQLQDVAIQELTSDSDSGIISKRIWGEVSGLMKTWIVNFRDLPINKVFVCQDRVTINEEEFDPEMITPEVGPALSPSIARSLNAAVDVIGQTFIREKSITVKTKKGGEKSKIVADYCMRLGPHARYTTKIRRGSTDGNLPQFISDPSFDKIHKIIH